MRSPRRAPPRGGGGPAPAAAPAASSPAPATEGGLDLSSLPSGHYAVPDGDSRLKVFIQQGKGKWAGWTFVKDGAEYGQGTRYGMQRPGETYRGKIEAALTAILDDPEAAVKAYGRLTGTCGICGRHLEDADSVAAGIGPICAGKMGW